MDNIMSIADQIIGYWFEGFNSPTESNQAAIGRWFRTPPDVVEQMRNIAGAEVENAINGVHDSWTETPRGTLALILLLDQWTRSLYKNSAQSFAGDQKALLLAHEAINKGFDKELWPVHRVFIYMPLMHSEDITSHELLVTISSQLIEETQEGIKSLYEMVLKYEVMHKVIIDKYGRFPHRNQMLGRESTPEEEEYNKANPNPF